MSSLYELLGGKAGCRRLAVALYRRVALDPILRPLFPGKSFTCAIEEFAAFLAQFLGGPGEDSQRRWWLSLRESHSRFRLGERERTAWLAAMQGALDDAEVGEPLRTELFRFFGRSSEYVVGRDGDAAPGERELDARWQGQLRLDQAIAAIRAGDAAAAIEWVESPAMRFAGRSVHCGLLAAMIRDKRPEVFAEYVRERLARDPSLAHERFAGRTLLHDAAAAGNLAVVTLLLEMGADANAHDGGRHTPVYSAGNECVSSAGPAVVFALARAGARIDACDGVKKCTALHMAARRGNEEVALALLTCGANMEARDSGRDTPLRRAVNCDKIGVASLLLARGADARSSGSKGLTPLQAARSAGMKELLAGHATMSRRIP